VTVVSYKEFVRNKTCKFQQNYPVLGVLMATVHIHINYIFKISPLIIVVLLPKKRYKQNKNDEIKACQHYEVPGPYMVRGKSDRSALVSAL